MLPIPNLSLKCCSLLGKCPQDWHSISVFQTQTFLVTKMCVWRENERKKEKKKKKPNRRLYLHSKWVNIFFVCQRVVQKKLFNEYVFSCPVNVYPAGGLSVQMGRKGKHVWTSITHNDCLSPAIIILEQLQYENRQLFFIDSSFFLLSKVQRCRR